MLRYYVLYISDGIRKTLKDWKDDDKMFIDTRAAKLVLKCIKENSCVTIIASSGVGKTATPQHVALQMAAEYDVLLVTDPSNIVNYYNPNMKILFVLDDLCGNFSVDQSDIKRWNPVIKNIKKYLDKKQTKILAACRLQVYQDEKFESLSIFKSCNPFSVYEAEVDNLQKKGHHTKYCALALCVMFNNNLKLELFTKEENEENRIIIENTCKACRLDKGTSRLVLQDGLKSRKGTFIKQERHMYKILHDKVFDFLVYYFGQKIILFLIKNADIGLIKERFLFERKDHVDHFITILPSKYHAMYIQRMVDDWSKGKVQDVFTNINIKVPQFRQKFLFHLKKKK
ncbi:unnamed protein product [Mytilus coruscus]|uniref:Novel STAND NTPase 3 domain-containing protein n=1 Tax=Mytilus coruscus TaxID=42192 RepID=A0A6J8C266_MYTCO|nr:unnamed protein product [Mytilus coruscus]